MEVCSNINEPLEAIGENAEDAYEQLKALLVSRFELLKYSEIGDIKPSEMM
jgi:hypothetical protein